MNILAQSKYLRERNAEYFLRVYCTTRRKGEPESGRGVEEIGLPRGTGGETNTRKEFLH